LEIVDLTHFISGTMPVFPGTEPPGIADAFTIERNGFAEKSLRLVSHTGTHVDAPGHILPGAPRLDAMGVECFLGAGLVLDVSAVRERRIAVDDILHAEERLRRVAFALLHTGWARRWGDAEYFGSYPVLSPAAAQWLAGFSLRGVGTDTISVDDVDSTALPVHRALFARGMLVIENLASLEPLLGKEFTFSCLPLKIADADGSPVRAVGIIDRDT
jgi:kynurenine formamidase